jgi:hypothetical protein
MNYFIWIPGAFFSLPIFIFLGGLIRDALKVSSTPPVLSSKGLDYSRLSKKLISRRRIESNPNIVCLFPISEEARKDAPLPYTAASG